MLICRNDVAAKKTVVGILKEFGWPGAIDLGGIEGARWLEANVSLWVLVGMKTGRWDEAKLDAAKLAFYVTAAYDPFNTTENSEGKLTAQSGVNERFGTALIDRYSSFFPLRPNDAVYINDPTDRAFEICLSSHSRLEVILLADRNAFLAGKSDSYNDDYYDRFYNQAAATLIRQLSDASTDVGSYWLTSWINAGKPGLPH